MHEIDPTRLDLAEQYKRNPFGPYDEELQKVLRLMHWDAAEDCFMAVQIEVGGAWYLARTRGGKGVALDVYLEDPYDEAGAVRWAVFRKRWQQRTGTLPVVDAGDEIDPAGGAVTSSADVIRPTLIGYANRFSAHPGQTVDFKVSSDLSGEYTAQLVRVRCGDAEHLGFKRAPVQSTMDGSYRLRAQPVHPGSYAEFPASPPGDALSFIASVWPTRLNSDGPQCIAGVWDEHNASGWWLGMNTAGALTARIGDGARVVEVQTQAAFLERHWHDVAVSIDLTRGVVWLGLRVHQQYAVSAEEMSASASVASMASAAVPFRVAAHSSTAAARIDGAPVAAGHFNGKIEAPSLFTASLDDGVCNAFLATGQVALAAEPWLSWDFSRDMAATTVVDIGPAARHGRTFNMPTRAMKSSAWNGDEYNWQHKPEHYAAIHFHDDDLHDCQWQTDFSLDVPADLPSGLYAAEITHAEDGSTGQQDWIPFVVSPPVGTAHAPLAVILPSASYWAYANRSSVIGFVGREHVRNTFATADPTSLYLHHHPELGLSMYDTHSDGSGVCISSRLRPVLSLRPNETLWQLPADTHLLDWLDEAGIAYDVLTEDDLDEYGFALLEPYRCVMTGTHPEYPSLAMLDAFQAFQNNGGRFMYMGGNGFYWRVSYHPSEAGVMEMRRGEDGIRAWLAEGGEYYHAFTGELGGMWRRMGRAPQSVAGAGMTAQGFDRSTYYKRTAAAEDARAAFIFAGVAAGERIGDFGIIGGGAAGWEIDRADTDLGTPPHALVVAQANTFSSAYHWMKEELTHTHASVTGDTCPLVRCDMVFYETPRGGAVFSTSSIAWAGALSHNDYDNNVARITRNVLERFLDPAPFAPA